MASRSDPTSPCAYPHDRHLTELPVQKGDRVGESTAAVSSPGLTPTRPVRQAQLIDAPLATAPTTLGQQLPELVVLSADLAKYTDIAPFAEKFPQRFFQVGMAE